MILRRITALIIKELLTLFRDPRSRAVLIGPPLLQLIIFSFAVTLEVKNVHLIVFNEDMGKHGKEIVQRLIGSPTFTSIIFTDTIGAFASVINEQKVIAAVHIPTNFSRQIESGQRTNVQFILDGRRSNASQIVNGYLTEVVFRYVRELRVTKGDVPNSVMIIERNWFNENLFYLWFTVPSLVVILTMLIALIVTALSVARERELGTFDQLLVSPLMPYQILVGKTVPAMIVGVAEGLLIWLVAVTVFAIPFTGSFGFLVFTLFVFVMSIVGTGLLISALAKTQQQAILGVFVFMVPAITLSGYAAPVENMPLWLQRLTWFNPLQHSLITVKGLFLKNLGLAELWPHTWPLLIIGMSTLTLASWFFKRRLE